MLSHIENENFKAGFRLKNKFIIYKLTLFLFYNNNNSFKIFCIYSSFDLIFYFVILLKEIYIKLSGVLNI